MYSSHVIRMFTISISVAFSEATLSCVLCRPHLVHERKHSLYWCICTWSAHVVLCMPAIEAGQSAVLQARCWNTRTMAVKTGLSLLNCNVWSLQFLGLITVVSIPYKLASKILHF